MAKSAVKTVLPSPLEIAKEAWEIYKKRFWYVVGVVALGVLTVLGYLALSGGIAFGISRLFENHLNIYAYIFIGILVLLFFLGLMVIISWIQASLIVVLRDWKEAKGSRQALRDGRAYAIPFFLVSLLTMVLIWGGLFLFIIPGILFGTWFCYATYAIVCEDKKGLLALHTSREYYRGKFWQIIGREIVVRLPEIIVSTILSILIAKHIISGSVNSFYQLISVILAPFYMSYSYVLYTKIRHATPEVTTVPTGNKKVYFGVPLVGFLLIIGLAAAIGPKVNTIIQDEIKNQKMDKEQAGNQPTKEQIQSYERQIDELEKKGTDGEVQAIVLGIQQYYLENHTFPARLSELSGGYVSYDLDPLPSNIHYTSLEKGNDFQLCLGPDNHATKATTCFTKDGQVKSTL